ncbi:hypothetical protein LEP1GSC096_3411 [Leptospira interrogans serovar Hebdomadis str. R499]|nr:hypothetical protein LEP1GSC096_3411 [Leptospira interrogans serovar Hebdomadis str. R499]
MRRIKNAHFSSVPTRMSLFICKKYVFLIEKNFLNLTTSVPHPKIGKTQHNALYESRWKTQHNALYESRWKTQHNALYESRWKTQHNAFLWVALENSAQRFPIITLPTS